MAPAYSWLVFTTLARALSSHCGWPATPAAATKTTASDAVADDELVSVKPVAKRRGLGD